jgi:hypothetical protein
MGVYCVRNSEAMVLFLSKEYLGQEHNFFYASHTIYTRFLCCGILWFAEHYFLGVLGSRLREAERPSEVWQSRHINMSSLPSNPV